MLSFGRASAGDSCHADDVAIVFGEEDGCILVFLEPVLPILDGLIEVCLVVRAERDGLSCNASSVILDIA